MAEVRTREDYDASPDEMWGRIGDFFALDAWHPAIEACESIDEGKRRELTLGDGAKVFETLIEQGERSYTYSIDESPLPVDTDYAATLRTEEADSGCTVLWEADFTPKGASEDEAVTTIEGIFRAGLDALKQS